MFDCLAHQKVVPLVAMLITASLSGCQFLQMHQGSQTVNVPHVPGTMLRVNSSNGGISVHQYDGPDVEIVAHLKAVSAERLAAARVIAERDENNALCVFVDWPEGRRRSREGCTFEILVPDADGVVLQTSNGRLSLSGCSGTADLKTSNGQIEVSDHVGKLVGKTSNGRIEVERITGPVELESSNGAINVDDVTSSVGAKTSNGSVEIRLNHESAGPVVCATSNGSVDLTLGAMFVGELTAKTSNGRVYLENLQGAQVLSSGKTNVHVIVGEPAHKSTVKTSNGSIRVRQRLEPLPHEQSNLPAEASL